MPTTIGEVRRAIADMPDDMPVILSVHYLGGSGAATVRDYNLDAMELLNFATKPNLTGWFHFIGHNGSETVR